MAVCGAQACLLASVCAPINQGGAVQYRLVSNYRDPKFLLGRIVDKLLCCVVLIILYNGLGKNAAPDNLINISSLLYMYTVLPGFAAISYMPGLVLERPLYVRCSAIACLFICSSLPLIGPRQSMICQQS